MPEENEIYCRSFDIDIRKIDKDKREMDISFSSDTEEVERWYGIEVLSHKKGAGSTKRLNSVGSFVYNHTAEIIGPIKSARIDSEAGKGYAKIGFDETDSGNLRFKQVNSKSLRGISFRYGAKRMRLLAPGEEYDLGTRKIKGRKDIEVYIVERWEGYEITATPVPADYTVGFGRTEKRTLDGIEIIKSNNHKEDKKVGDSILTTEVKIEIGNEITRAIKGALPGIVSEIHEKLKEDQKPKLRVATDTFKDLVNRASAISAEAMNEVTNQLLAGKTEPEVLRFINDKIIEKGGSKTKLPKDDGTGRHIEGEGDSSKRMFKNVTDEEFFVGIKNPIPFAVSA